MELPSLPFLSLYSAGLLFSPAGDNIGFETIVNNVSVLQGVMSSDSLLFNTYL